jgi:hypothetical protein
MYTEKVTTTWRDVTIISFNYLIPTLGNWDVVKTTKGYL